MDLEAATQTGSLVVVVDGTQAGPLAEAATQAGFLGAGAATEVGSPVAEEKQTASLALVWRTRRDAW